MEIINTKVTYPTDWLFGKSAGSISDETARFRASIKKNGEKKNVKSLFLPRRQ